MLDLNNLKINRELIYDLSSLPREVARRKNTELDLYFQFHCRMRDIPNIADITGRRNYTAILTGGQDIRSIRSVKTFQTKSIFNNYIAKTKESLEKIYKTKVYVGINDEFVRFWYINNLSKTKTIYKWDFYPTV